MMEDPDGGQGVVDVFMHGKPHSADTAAGHKDKCMGCCDRQDGQK